MGKREGGISGGGEGEGPEVGRREVREEPKAARRPVAGAVCLSVGSATSVLVFQAL